MQKDVKLMEDLYPLLMILSQLQSLLADTYVATNSEAYTAALRGYNSAKSNATLPGMKIVVEELKQQFARRNQKAATPAGAGEVKVAIA